MINVTVGVATYEENLRGYRKTEEDDLVVQGVEGTDLVKLGILGLSVLVKAEDLVQAVLKARA